MFNVGIIGASGYTGHELVNLLHAHPKVKLSVLNSSNYAGSPVSKVYPNFKEPLTYTNYSIEQINKMNLDALFLAVPHKTAMSLVPQLTCKVIDLSADYRFEDKTVYNSVYGVQHTDSNRQSVYGLPELFNEEIASARIIGNPGCYATGMILSAQPVQRLAQHIIFDGKSGWSGAGKLSVYAKDRTILSQNIQAYNIAKHRHSFEVEQFVSCPISFTPHVIDAFRGMMITSHILLKEPVADVYSLYKEYYANHPFVSVVSGLADLHQVQGTNSCIIGGFEIDKNNRLVVVCVLDNLLKGASGQAVQNMNIMLGIDQTIGLKTASSFKT